MRFPKYHLAASVVNRILNVADQVAAMPEPTQAPVMPDTQKQGKALDQALAQPPAAVPAPQGADELIAMENMAGGSAADAVAASGIMDAMQ